MSTLKKLYVYDNLYSDNNDTVSGGSMLIGKVNATKIEISKSGTLTEVQGPLEAKEGLDVTGDTEISGRAVIGGTGINTNALLDLRSTTLGLLIPRMSTVARDALSATGLVIFNTITDTLEFRNSTFWQQGVRYAGDNPLTNLVIGETGTGDIISTGVNNTFIGTATGVTVTSGGNNTCIGSTSNAVATLDNQTAIGYGATCDAANQMTLGNTSLTAVRPGVDGAVDLGSPSRQFKDLYLSGNAVIGGQAYSILNTLTDVATIATDCNLGNVHTITLTANRTLGAPTNLKSGATYIWMIIQDGGGTNTLAYNSVFKFEGGITPVLSMGGNAVDLLTGVSDGVNIYCSMGLNYS